MHWLISIAILLVLGLIVGAIAKSLLPGDDPGGGVTTSFLGVLGAFLGGWIANRLEIGGLTGLDWRSLIIAVGGSVLLLLAYRAFRMLAPAPPSLAYATGRSTAATPLRGHGAWDDEDASSEPNLADVAKQSMTTEVMRALSDKTGEGPNQTRRAMDALIPTMLASASRLASTSSGAGQLFDLVKGALQGGLERHLADGDYEAVSRQGQGLLQMLFGDKLGNLLNWLARYAGVKESSASTLMHVASGLIMSVLGKTIQQKGLDASTFGRLLSSQAGWFAKLLPSGIGDVPGMRGLADLGDRAAQAGRATVDAGRRVGAAAERASRETVGAAQEAPSLLSAFLPLVLLALPLLLFASWMRGTAPKVIQPNEKAVAEKPRAEPPKVAAPEIQASTPAPPQVEAARELIPTTLKMLNVKLPDGVDLQLREGSFLNEVYKFLSNANAPQGRTFTFEDLDFDAGVVRDKPETQTAVAKLSTLLHAYPSVKLKIEGHTDKTDDPARDKRESLDRAESLKSLLVKAGVPSDRITTEGVGGEKPLVDNDTPEGRVKNRRIELSVQKSP